MKTFKSQFLLASLIFLVAACATSERSVEEKRADLFYANGTSKLVEQNYSEALDNLLKAVELRPKDTKILNNLGMAYYLKKQPQEAKKYFLKALDIDEKNSDARNNLASLYYSLGQYGLAEEEYTKVKNDLVYKHQYRTFYNLALIAQKKNKTPEAISLLQSSTKELDSYCPAHFELGKIYKSQLRFHDALKEFLAAHQGTCVKDPEPLYEQALIQMELGQYAKAKQKFIDILSRYRSSAFAPLASKKIRIINEEILPEEKIPSKESDNVSSLKNDFNSPTF